MLTKYLVNKDAFVLVIFSFSILHYENRSGILLIALFTFTKL